MFHRFYHTISRFNIFNKFTFPRYFPKHNNPLPSPNNNKPNINLITSSVLIVGSGYYLFKTLESNQINKISWLQLKELLQQENKISKIEIKNKKAFIYSNYPLFIISM